LQSSYFAYVKTTECWNSSPKSYFNLYVLTILLDLLFNYS